MTRPASSALRPRRSVLYMPASKERALEKAKTLDVDAIILDLEDAVAPAAKEAARAQAAGAVRDGGYGGRELVIRINGLDTPWGADDLTAAAEARPHAILVPKVSDAAMLEDVAGRLYTLDPAQEVALWAMMETPRGILNAAAIADATPRLTALVMGTNDLAKELHSRAMPDRQAMLTSLEMVVLAARAAGLAAIDGVFGDLNDDDGLARECAQGVGLGFDGKTLIHPKQLAAANTAFAPAADDIADARRIIEGWEREDGDAKGVVTVDGRMIEALHVDQARRLVALKDAIDARG
ncbi:citrate lyase subunit beta/citryl-CoA lyase [Rhodothalassium salexigens DSM 2132]|uniref:Citrate lyase subunit beta/citryl-CoA lyase n=1 Tax=Rhodothalassium salexigens DSM 2132 TaxID=1188247 RepID=A0A4R2PFX3_RHOSA|nr:CoA ester lyase [Rhodothalassium salexigens]MBB4211998.1 citrate lyase subunit beta/citryl-CoA lyase [Rhodothalassium salexigens DSM 2132]MBK1638516.1 CoA ester lyase [Rhodothalassium salexigens DSM 2132]TCP33418.1 citrate lyase subunit beta/citryl-CoA lyase [Rhodothalassium salexigens DSM 2132]